MLRIDYYSKSMKFKEREKLGILLEKSVLGPFMCAL